MQPKKITPQEQVDRAERYKEMMQTEAWKTFESSMKKLYEVWGLQIEKMNDAKGTRDERLDKIDRLLWKRDTIKDVMDIPFLAIEIGKKAQQQIDKLKKGDK